jgi:hypothetical protein
MKRILAGTAAVALMSLAACNSSPREQAADNIEANAERVADNLENAADNAPTEASEDRLENRADAARELGTRRPRICGPTIPTPISRTVCRMESQA